MPRSKVTLDACILCRELPNAAGANLLRDETLPSMAQGLAGMPARTVL